MVFCFWSIILLLFFDSKTRLTSKSNFFQLIFYLKLYIVVKGVNDLIAQNLNLERQSFEHGT